MSFWKINSEAIEQEAIRLFIHVVSLRSIGLHKLCMEHASLGYTDYDYAVQNVFLGYDTCTSFALIPPANVIMAYVWSCNAPASGHEIP